MIELPRHLLTSTTPTASSSKNKMVQFQVISKDEHPPILAIERRRTPSRRKPLDREGKQQIERRVSYDRRRAMFSSKA